MRRAFFFFATVLITKGRNCRGEGRQGSIFSFFFKVVASGGHRVSSSSSSRILRRWPDQSGSAESSPQLKFSNCKAKCSESGKFFLHVGATANLNPLMQTPYDKKKKETRAKKGKNNALKCLNSTKGFQFSCTSPFPLTTKLTSELDRQRNSV